MSNAKYAQEQTSFKEPYYNLIRKSVSSTDLSEEEITSRCKMLNLMINNYLFHYVNKNQLYQ